MGGRIIPSEERCRTIVVFPLEISDVPFQDRTVVCSENDASLITAGAPDLDMSFAFARDWERLETTVPLYGSNGNVRGYWSVDEETPVAEYDYGAFGEPLQVNIDGDRELPFGFSTKYTDSFSGLLYYGFRYYTPETGRWLSRDPIGERGGLNLYGFVGNDGVNYWDYLGMAITEHFGLFEPAPDIPRSPDNQDGGRTWSDWYENGQEVATRNEKSVQVSGELKVFVSFLAGIDPRAELGLDGWSVWDHELHHVKIWSAWWNNMKQSVDTIEGSYSSEKCAQIATDAANTISSHNMWSAYFQNVRFDINQYGNLVSEKQRRRLISSRNDAERIAEKRLRKLEKLENRWTSNKCCKLEDPQPHGL